MVITRERGKIGSKVVDETSLADGVLPVYRDNSGKYELESKPVEGKVGTKEVDEASIDDGKIPVYRTASGKYELETVGGGGEPFPSKTGSGGYPVRVKEDASGIEYRSAKEMGYDPVGLNFFETIHPGDGGGAMSNLQCSAQTVIVVSNPSWRCDICGFKVRLMAGTGQYGDPTPVHCNQGMIVLSS